MGRRTWASAIVFLLAPTPVLVWRPCIQRLHGLMRNCATTSRTVSGVGAKPWLTARGRPLMDDHSYGSAVKFWSAVRQRSVELYQRRVVPGSDCALTEVVHCKSANESYGVRDASPECSGFYFRPTIEHAARVIVVLGDIAADQCGVSSHT